MSWGHIVQIEALRFEDGRNPKNLWVELRKSGMLLLNEDNCGKFGRMMKSGEESVELWEADATFEVER